ncbi:hypothetical protein IG631_05121 [Alternaria alternata]|nr:hypothetical protein IG631_05121 [Alternaria alternata]
MTRYQESPPPSLQPPSPRSRVRNIAHTPVVVWHTNTEDLQAPPVYTFATGSYGDRSVAEDPHVFADSTVILLLRRASRNERYPVALANQDYCSHSLLIARCSFQRHLHTCGSPRIC